MERLSTVLEFDNVEPCLISLIRTILAASKEIAFRVGQGELAGVLGSTMDENIQGEVQKKLDVLANQLLKDMLLADKSVKAIASEEEDTVVAGNESGKYAVAFDPLDGSSNIEVGGQIGTIFTIFHAIQDESVDSEAHFKQVGTKQLCAGYVLYGASTLLVLTTGGPSRGFTLDKTTGSFLLTTPKYVMPYSSNEVAVNMSNYPFWEVNVQRYFSDTILKPNLSDGMNLRWNAAMVGDIHKVLTRGGVFYYPKDSREGMDNGKLRLLYEALPMAFIVEQAGGEAIGEKRLITMAAVSLHQRVPCAIGCKRQVSDFFSYDN